MSETKPLRRKARARRAGVTMADVAAEAGVSMQTVSRALREPHTVAPETLELITAAIRKTHYVHNLAASVLASPRSTREAVEMSTPASRATSLSRGLMT